MPRKTKRSVTWFFEEGDRECVWKDNAAPNEDNILGSVDDGRLTRRQRRKTET